MNTEHPETILIVTNKQGDRRLLNDLLTEAGFQCTASPDADQALQILKQKNIALVIADIRMPGRDGMALFQEIREKHPDTHVILLAEQSAMEKAIEAMKCGAYDFATKPKGLHRIPILAGRAFEYMNLKRQLTHIQTEMRMRYHLDNLLFQSEAMQKIHEIVRHAADSEAVILIQGESGTGKDLLARTIHHNSARSQGPFIRVECAAFPEKLLESELFGHENTMLQGVITRKIGRFELAEGGTLFLDGVIYLSPSLQQRLLQVMQKQRFKRVGGTTSLRFDVRIIAATHMSPDEAVHGERFDQALSTHLHVVTIELPPLRHRIEDIPLLATHFLDVFCTRLKCPIKEISRDAMRLLMDYHWPGNIRELRHTMEYAVTVCSTDSVRPADLPHHILPRTTTLPATFNYNENEQWLLTRVLQKTQGNIRQAAALLDISRTTLYSKMRKHKMTGVRTRSRQHETQ